MTSYDMRISDWSSDVCSSDLKNERTDENQPRSALADASENGDAEPVDRRRPGPFQIIGKKGQRKGGNRRFFDSVLGKPRRQRRANHRKRSEEHTSELQSLMRNSYAVFCLKKKKNTTNRT